MSDRMERARAVLAATPHNADCLLNGNPWDAQDTDKCDCDRTERAMLAFADAELERAALAVANLAYRVRHPSAGMDHEMEMYDDGCKDAATAIRNMKEE